MTSSGEVKPGAAALPEAVLDGEGDGAGAGQQLPLLALPLGDTAESQAVETELERRGRGRPRGSRNKRSEDFLGFLRTKYRSPLEVKAAAWSMPTSDLAAKLHCTMLEAYEVQQRAATDALPYWHQKQPVAVELDAKGTVQVVLEVSQSMAKALGSEEDGLVLEGHAVDVTKSEG